MRLSPTVFYILKLQILIFYILKQIFPSTFQTSSGMVCLPSAANRGDHYFPTTCGICSRGPSTVSAGMWRSWRMCLGAVPLKPHAFTLSPLELNMPKRWICSGWCRRPKQQNRTESAFYPLFMERKVERNSFVTLLSGSFLSKTQKSRSNERHENLT